MKKLTSKEIRNMWLEFWKSKGHEIVPSKSLIPQNDPSLLWINSGVATLKDYFSGKVLPKNPRITNSQKSIRTNDIENVGVTARHHTFFEMLGNFSIGDYFKKEVIVWAWELLTEVYKLPKEKLYFTYFEEDKETHDLWISLGVDPSHLIKGDREMNFWDVGQGPCGPDTEIFYDRGEKYDPENIGLRLLQEDLENDRYVEIWNIVFSQFNNDGKNNYTELAQKNIDTGAGLERIVSIFQDAPTNFDTDLFIPLIKEIEVLSGKKYDPENYFKNDLEVRKVNKHFRIIADHVRAVSLAIEDGAKPSNAQRGYIIRRLIRRAYRSGLQLGIKDETFLYKLVKVVSEILDVYPINVEAVSKIIKKEEKAFALTIRQGEELLEKQLLKTPGKLEFKIAFNLFETYGFPIELTQEILEEKGIKLDISKFDEYKKMHADASRGAKKSGMDSQIQVIQKVNELKSSFVGYEKLHTNSIVVFSEMEDDKAYTLLNETPFYPTGGGQHQDLGKLNDEEVLDVFKDKHGNIWHVTHSVLEGKVDANVDFRLRLQKSSNHSATHLLGAALRKVFGNGVKQLGSDNDQNRLRFDFPLEKRPSSDELVKVEKIVNDFIEQGINREYIETSFDEGKAMGAITLEGENYGDQVRVVKFNDVIEFCGGTHVANSKEIESFKITKFESKGSGVFRIEAITGNQAVEDYINAQKADLIKSIEIQINKAKKIDSNYSFNISDNLESLKEDLEKIKSDIKKLTKQQANKTIDTQVEFTTYEGKKTYINLELEPAVVKNTAITLREAHNDSLIIVGATNGGRTTLAVASKAFNSKEEFDKIANKFNGRGGGNESFAMGSMEEVNL